ncbi:hypothetical protein NLJ89_g7468 [Agrocybe chaxingu]|uniref:F-box domain-containing protein n=1 Tax=Agrocybe chaxingu TaxID=84603 RepID=A0A9W8K3K3_9AGAR|nr:hypothetical protein NLJ89_g7468 [Agrocybe chaxingu]
MNAQPTLEGPRSPSVETPTPRKDLRSIYATAPSEQTSTFCATNSPALNNVPVEIWQHIFHLCYRSEHVPELDELSGPIWGRTTPPPAFRGRPVLPRTPSMLSQVCSRWRDVAFGMAELWNVLYAKTARIDVNHDQTARETRTENRAKLVASRVSLARNVPLKICVNAKDDLQGAKFLIRAILPFSRRWETLHILAPGDALREFSCLKPEDVPLLSSFKTYEQTYNVGILSSSPPPNCDRFQLCNIAPSLRQLCTSILPTVSAVGFCGNLHELNLQQSPSETWSILHVLSFCRQLRVLTLSGYGVTMDHPSPHYPAVELSELITLNLEHPVGRERLLQMLVLPKLAELKLLGKCDGASPQTVLHEIKELTKRSEVTSLERFSVDFDSHGLQAEDLIDFLACQPLLRAFRIAETPWNPFRYSRPLITSRLVSALSEVRDQKKYRSSADERSGNGSRLRLCPSLQRLSLIGCSECLDEDLITFLKRRLPLEHGAARPSLPRLVAVEMSMKRATSRELQDVVEKLQQNGLQIQVHRA